MSASAMWAEIKANIAAITPYQGTDPTLALAYRDQVGQAFAQGIIDQLFVPLVWTSGPDLQLGINQSAKTTASAATSIPLHIACGNGQVYSLEIVGTYTPAAAAAVTILQPNNTAPATNSFRLNQMYNTGATPIGNFVAAQADGGFRLEAGGSSLLASTSKIWTSTAYKHTISNSSSGTSTTPYLTDADVLWNDTTTVWSSLGTLIFPNSWTGTVTVTRKA